MDRISPEELSAIAAYQRQRDELAMKMGVAAYEYQEMQAGYVRRIKDSLRQEHAAVAEILGRYGVNPERARIDLSSGEIIRG